MSEYLRYQKRLAKRAGISTKEVKEIWEEVRKDILSTCRKEDLSLMQDTAAGVRKRLGIEENTKCLDKFKKFLS